MASWLKEIVRTRRGKAAVAGLLALMAMLVTLRGADESDRGATDNATFEVRQGPLTISIRESGTIKARDQVIIKSEVEGDTQIISLIDEGAHVEKGDLLVELDASTLRDNRVDQEIRVQNAEAAYINARENLEVVKSKAESDIKAAELAYQFAKEDLTKYVEGDYPMEVRRAQADIAVAESEMSRTQEQLAGSKRLFDEGYLTSIEYERDRQNAEKAELDLQLAKSALELLQQYTYKRRMTELESGIEEAESALERARLTAAADVVQAEADFRAKESEYTREQEKLAKLDRQIERTRIHAPTSGVVVYATTAEGGWGDDEPLEEGQTVRERQELIYLPTASNMMAEVSVHESNLSKIRPGLGVRITADAVPGRVFTGHVLAISPMPDSRRSWMRPDTRVYPTRVSIEGDASELKTGMNCQAEIMIEHLEDAVYVPVQSIYSVEGTPTAFVKTLPGVELRPVVLGHDNGQMIHIVEGLEAGEEVLLAPPLDLAVKVDDTAVRATSDAPFVAPEETRPQTETPPIQTTEAEPEVSEPESRPGGEWANLSESERAERRERFMNMSEEERARLLQERMAEMTPEQRERMQERMQQFEQGSGGGPSVE